MSQKEFDPMKGYNQSSIYNRDYIAENCNAMIEMLNKISMVQTNFSETKTIIEIIRAVLDYNSNYDRFIYSETSKFLFKDSRNIKNKNRDCDKLDTLLNNTVKAYNFSKVQSGLSDENKDPEYVKILKEFKICSKDLENKIFKLYDHINLAFNQLNSFIDSDDEFSQRIDPKIDAQVTQAKIEVKDNIYGQLIGIVGIFTAISFMVFGTWNLSELTLTQFKDTSSMLISWSLLLLGCLTIIISLLWGISKLIDKRLFDSYHSKVFVVILYLMVIIIFIFGFATRSEQPSQQKDNSTVSFLYYKNIDI